MFCKLIQDIIDLKTAKTHILSYPDLAIRANQVNLHQYHPELESKSNYSPYNLGDFLSSVVVDYCCRKNNIKINNKTSRTYNLYAIGSLLLMGHQSATVWGSGLPYKPFLSKTITHYSILRKLDIRLVRGPLTQAELVKLGHDCPNIYGDPALIMPFIYNPTCRKISNEYGVIPHYSMENKVEQYFDRDNIISMRTNNYKRVINRICTCSRIITSSLHGMILAEAYGVPVVLVSDRPKPLLFKYEDYLMSTERYLSYENTWEEGLNSSKILPLPQNLRSLQLNIISTFPADIWRERESGYLASVPFSIFNPIILILYSLDPWILGILFVPLRTVFI